MPGEEVEDGIRNLFELDNSSQGQHFSHAVNGNWSVLNDNLWVGKQRHSVAPLNFNLKNYGVQKLGINGFHFIYLYIFCFYIFVCILCWPSDNCSGSCASEEWQCSPFYLEIGRELPVLP